MNKEKLKQNKSSIRELESHHFNQGSPPEIEKEFLEDNTASFDNVKKLLFYKQAKLILEEDFQNLTRALVKNNEGKIIFSTTFVHEIEELADIAYNTSR